MNNDKLTYGQLTDEQKQTLSEHCMLFTLSAQDCMTTSEAARVTLGRMLDKVVTGGADVLLRDRDAQAAIFTHTLSDDDRTHFAELDKRSDDGSVLDYLRKYMTLYTQTLQARS